MGARLSSRGGEGADESAEDPMDQAYMMLRHAADTGDAAEAKKWLAAGGGAKLIGRRTWSESPLHIACCAPSDASVAVVEALLSARPSHAALTEKTSDGLTPLATAARAASLRACELLVSAGVDPSGDNRALREAVSRGANAIVEFLLAHSADTTGCLSAAMEHAESLALVRRLLAAGAKPSEEDLWTAASFSLEAVRLMLGAGAKIDKESRALDRSVNYRVSSADTLEVLRMLLAAGAKAKSASARYALYSLAIKDDFDDNHLASMRLLCGAGTDPGCPEGGHFIGGSVIDEVCKMPQAKPVVIEFLLERTRPTDLALFNATTAHNAQAVQILANAGARGDVIVDNGSRRRYNEDICALHYALQDRKPELAKIMLDSGNTELPESDRKARWADYCIEIVAGLQGKAALEILEYFLQRRPLHADNSGPLYMAIMHGNIEAFELLLRHGTSVDASHFSRTPLEAAVLATDNQTFGTKQPRVFVKMAIRLVRLGAKVTPLVQQRLRKFPKLLKEVRKRDVLPVAELMLVACSRDEGTVLELLDFFTCRTVIEFCVNDGVSEVEQPQQQTPSSSSSSSSKRRKHRRRQSMKA